MSIEAGARAGMVTPDDTTFAYLAGRPYAPRGTDWDRAVSAWRDLASDQDAVFDHTVRVDADALAPMVTWGTSPEDGVPITGHVPDPAVAPTAERRDAIVRALHYMGLTPGTALAGVAVDRVFIGSCTNGRIEDLRAAAAIAKDRKVAANVEAWVVPGSGLVKAQAESEGLDRIFMAAGFQWRHAGCSMCLGTNGEIVAPGQRCASTTNRNFVGRQGPGSRTHLMSPAMAAAAAVTAAWPMSVNWRAAEPMEAFRRVDAVALPIAQANFDTDQIFPARFLSRPRSGAAASICFTICDGARTERKSQAFYSTAPPTATRGSSWANAISLAVRRAKMPYGHCTMPASARPLRQVSAISFSPTASRMGCCP